MRFVSPADTALPTLDQWLAATEPKPDGVSVSNDVDVIVLEPHLSRLARIDLQFPKWTDGRAYSQARLLRARWRFAGEIRATGEVLVDMLPLLARTGFDAAALRADQKSDAARRALDFFPGHYQGDLTEPRPWFARGAA